LNRHLQGAPEPGGQVTMDDASVTGPGATINIDLSEPEAEP
jgi:hypothetical protein